MARDGLLNVGRRRLSLWVLASGAGKGVSLFRDLAVAAFLGLGGSLDRYVLLTTPSQLVGAGLFTVSLQRLIPLFAEGGNAASRRHARSQIVVVTAVAMALLLVLMNPVLSILDLPSTLMIRAGYICLVLTVGAWALAGWLSARLHAIGRSALPLALPLLGPILTVVGLLMSATLTWIVVSMILGWGLDLALLGLLLRRSEERQPSHQERAETHAVARLIAAQALMAATVLVDRYAAARLEVGVAAASAYANRIVFGVLAVTVGSLVPHVMAASATSERRIPSKVLVPTALATIVLTLGVAAIFSELSPFLLALVTYTAGAPVFILQMLSVAILSGQGRYGGALVVALVSSSVNVVGDLLAIPFESPAILLSSTVLGGAAAVLSAVFLFRAVRQRIT